MDAHDWDRRYGSVDQVWSTEPNRFVAEDLADLPPGRATDIACGEGRNALWLARRGWRTTGIDFSPVAIERAAQLAGDVAVDWRVGDVTSADLPEADLVVLAYLQLPEPQRGRAVRHAFASLAEGGTFFLVAHDSTNLSEGTGGPQDPAVLYTAEDVLADLNAEADSATYDVVRAERVARPVAAQDEHGGTRELIAWDALVRLVRRG